MRVLKLNPALDWIGSRPVRHKSSFSATNGAISPGEMNTKKIASIIAHQREQSRPVYKITIGDSSGIGLTEKLARGFQAALHQLGKGGGPRGER